MRSDPGGMRQREPALLYHPGGANISAILHLLTEHRNCVGRLDFTSTDLPTPEEQRRSQSPGFARLCLRTRPNVKSLVF